MHRPGTSLKYRAGNVLPIVEEPGPHQAMHQIENMTTFSVQDYIGLRQVPS